MERAAQQADSLRALPIVRRTVLSQVQVIRAQSAKLELLAQQNAAWAADHQRLRNENESLGNLLGAQTQAMVQWRTKAKRRGWVIGLGIGLPAAYGLYTLLR